MDILKTAPMLVYVLLLVLVESEAGACGTAWFGSKCQYKCRCTDNKCDDNGICKDGSKCSTGWFGPACQYADLASIGQIHLIGGSETHKLGDGDENTCVDASYFKSFTVDWSTPFPFTWMRIQVQKLEKYFFQDFEIQFVITSNTDTRLNCDNKRTSFINPTTIDIHCDLNVAVDQVIVSSKNVQSICSVYISGGRNVALKQNTSQSTTLAQYFSSTAVNDELTWQDAKPSCTHTGEEKSPHWNLNFSHPVSVNRYVLYNRKTCCSERLSGFILESFTSDGNPILNHKDKQGTQSVYTVLSVSEEKPVSRVKITATYRAPENVISVLTLCEVQIFGDIQCPKGQYGIECNKRCNCAKDEDCFVSTGGCPSGCAAGFYREGCQEECPTSYHGIDCLKPCKNTCRNQSCDRVTGQCHGCVDGKQGDICTEECGERTYGKDCKESCSEFCKGDGSCDSVTGTCTHGCKMGYQGATCNDTCSPTTFGTGCSLQCIWCKEGLTNKDRACNHVTGDCHYGCLPGYEKLCESGTLVTGISLGVKIGIGVTSTVIVILAVVLGFVLYRRKKKSALMTSYEKPQNVVSYTQDEHQCEDLNQDGEYCEPIKPPSTSSDAINTGVYVNTPVDPYESID